jgi:N-carbamoylputrescine amidase
MASLTLTVCELPDEPNLLQERWQRLAEVVRRDGTDLVLLPELPFAPWLCSAPVFDAGAWQAAVQRDRAWRARLPELGAGAVLATRLVEVDGERFNEAYLWTADGGEVGLRRKAHLPHEDGFWEQSWFTPAEPAWDGTRVGPLRVGVLVCSELWDLEQARAYHRAGTGLIVVPRASTLSWCERWLAGGRTAALLSGAWCASANRRGGALGFGGDSWVVDPDGQLVARTSLDRPIVSATVDADLADLAGERYPRPVLPD